MRGFRTVSSISYRFRSTVASTVRSNSSSLAYSSDSGSDGSSCDTVGEGRKRGGIGANHGKVLWVNDLDLWFRYWVGFLFPGRAEQSLDHGGVRESPPSRIRFGTQCISFHRGQMALTFAAGAPRPPSSKLSSKVRSACVRPLLVLLAHTHSRSAFSLSEAMQLSR